MAERHESIFAADELENAANLVLNITRVPQLQFDLAMDLLKKYPFYRLKRSKDFFIKPQTIEGSRNWEIRYLSSLIHS